MPTATRTLMQLAHDAQELSAHTGMNQAVSLVVTPEEKKILDHFVDGLPGQRGGCTQLHGCPIRVEGKQQMYSRVLLIYQNLNECDFQAYVVDTPSQEKATMLRNAHNEFAAVDEENPCLNILDKWMEEGDDADWVPENPANLLNRGPFDLVVICGRNY
jgi:hypothetical protein